MNRVSLSSEANPSYYGWIVVCVVFTAGLLAFGFVYSFGVFFKPLAAQFHWSRASIAGIFSAYMIIHNMMAPATGRLADKLGPKITTIAGGFCIGLTMLLMRYVSEIWQVYLLYSIVFSFGIASIYAPLMAVVSQWFTAKRGLAMGITTAGIGAGSMVFSPFSAWLISFYGWQAAYTTMGIICWVLFIPIAVFIRQAPKSTTPPLAAATTTEDSNAGFTSMEAMKEKAFWMMGIAWFFGAIAIWAVMIHYVSLLGDMGISLTTAGSLAGLIGGASIVARVCMGILSDKIGRKRSLLIASAIQLIGLIFLLFCQNLPMFVIFSIVFGLGLGAFASVMPALPADLFGLKATATILGLIVAFAGAGGALGAFAGGYIFDATGGYSYMIWLTIGSSIASIIFISLIKRPLKR